MTPVPFVARLVAVRSGRVVTPRDSWHASSRSRKALRIPPIAQLALVAVTLFGFGCSDSDAGDSGVDAPDGGDGGCGPSEVEGPGGHCFLRITCPDTIPTFRLGLEAAGRDDLYTAVIVDAMPSPPQQFLNHWVVDFVDADGAPVADIEIDFVEPFMPAHAHDGARDPEWQPLDEPGRFDVDFINMWMPGPWEVRFDVSGLAGSDHIVFDVCI